MQIVPQSGDALTGFGSRRRDLAILGAFSACYFAVTCALAARSPLWYDELCSVYLARLDPADLWKSLAAGTDAAPPLFHLATRLAQKAFGDTELPNRLPAVLGFWLLCVCLYAFVGRRCGRPYATVALLFPLVTGIYPHSYNARPYGMLLGSGGLALVCWQAAGEGHRRRWALAGLAMAMAVAFASHYYALLLWGPIALGEIARTLRRGRIDYPVWFALAAGPAVLACLLPVVLGTKNGLGAFAIRPEWTEIAGIYRFLLKNDRWPFLAAMAVALLVPRKYFKPGAVARPAPPVWEYIAALALAAIPIYGVCMGRWATGMFTARYASAMILGVAILLAFTVAQRTSGNRAFAWILTAVFALRFGSEQWKEYGRLGVSNDAIARMNGRFQANSAADLPIVVADPFAFIQQGHYAPSSLRPRIVYLSDPEALRRHNPTDPRDWSLRRLREWSDISVLDYRTFLDGHPRFLMQGDNGWLRAALEGDGYSFRPADPETDDGLFAVEAVRP